MEGGGGMRLSGSGGGNGSSSSGSSHGNILDPSAQEFHPSSSFLLPHQFPLLPHQMYFPYPSPAPPPPPPLPLPPPPLPPVQYPRPAYVSHGPTEALPDAIETRSLLLTSVPPNVTEGLVRMELEGFGGVRAVDMSRLFEEGIVTVHFYDLRSARSAMDGVRGQHVRQQGRVWHQMQQQGNWVEMGSRGGPDGLVVGRGMVGGRAVWAQFAPEMPVGVDGFGNGSLVVFNLDPTVSSDDLRQVFEPYGAVKETRETPMKPRHKFVEFYDVRDAARALLGLHGKELFGKKIAIQLSRPGGNGRSNYCRKSSIHQAIQLPPRLVGLPRTSSGKSSSSSSHGRGGGGSPPQSSEANSNTNDTGSIEQQKQHFMPPKRSSSDRKHASSSSSTSKQKNWKNQHRNRASAEARFLIKGGDTTMEGGSGGGGSSSSSSSACRDSRTTVMIKNIPNKYSQKLLLNMLDIHCIHCNEQIVADEDEEREPFSSYDFVYLPIDFNNKCNVGYGFVNMTSPEATWRLYKAFHSRPWEVFNSRKICQITYARLQGLEALMEHFRNSKFACDNDEYMPVVFSPPRDGKNCTSPSTIGGRGVSSSSVTNIASAMTLLRLPSSISDDPTEPGGSSSPSDGHDDEEDDDGV